MRRSLDINNAMLKPAMQLASTARTALNSVELPIVPVRGSLQSGIGNLKNHRARLDTITDANLAQ